MAIARGAGTEILRSAHFEYNAAVTTTYPLIVGVQHHIYTVVNITAYNSRNTTQTNTNLTVTLTGYDTIGGDTAQSIILFKTGSTTGESSYVWNDKFSFNGFEPVDFVGPMDNATKQDAIADQGSSVAQKLQMTKGHNDDGWMVHITYIDQNNA